ncbi:uncharacterized protein [Arachis hypogaea]|uniref:uncharacterized protein n=1 Tax=Arachis hypogaea TaxID=3818 RepID=UPI003B217A7D
MALQLADRTFKFSHGVVEDLLVKVGEFIFPTDFVVLDKEEEANTSIILGRPFLATAGAIIDVQKGELVLRLREEKMVFNIFTVMSYPKESIGECMMVDTMEKLVQRVLEEEQCEEEIEQNQQISCGELPQEIIEGSIMLDKANKKEVEAPKLELKTLPPSLKYAYLGDNDTYPVIINSSLSEEQEEKLINVLNYRKLNEATRKDHFPLPFMDQMLERLAEHEYYYFLDGYSGYNQIIVDLKDQEKTSFTCLYDVFAYRRMPLVCAMHLPHSKALKYLLTKQNSKLRLIRWILLLQEFNIEIKYRSRAENKVANHLSRIPHEENEAHSPGVNESFPDEQLMMIQEAPWFADIANFKAIRELPSNINKHLKRKLINDAKYYIWDEPYLFKRCAGGILRRCISHEEGQEVLWHCHGSVYGGHFSGERTAAKVLQCGFFWPTIFKDAKKFVTGCNECQRTGNLPKKNEMPQRFIMELELFDVWGIDFMGPFQPSYSNNYILVAMDYVSCKNPCFYIKPF